MRKYFGLTLATTGLVALPVASMAAPSLGDVLGASGIAASGHISGGYEFFTNDGPNVGYHQFDTNANSFTLNQADLTISSLPSSGFGGLVEVLAGNDAKAINGALGTGSGDFSLPQAYVQYATGKLTVIGGRYWTLAGAEVTDDSKNSNISRSFLFTIAEPFTHTGVRASYKATDTLTGYLGVANSAVPAGGATALDNNKQKTLELGGSFAPSSTTSVGVYDYYGIDPNTSSANPNAEMRVNYLDAVAATNLTPALQLVINADYARSIPVNDSSGNSYVYGFAGYLNYTFNDKLKGSLRGEYLKTKGVVIGSDPTANDSCANEGKCGLSEITATVDYAAAKNFDLLGEVRDDMGDKVYPDSGKSSGFSDSQPEFEVKAIYKFGTT
jgi:hypothetical protein